MGNVLTGVILQLWWHKNLLGYLVKMQVPMFQPQSFWFIRSVRGSPHLCCKKQSCDLMQGIPGTILGKYCVVSTMGHAVSFAISLNLINKLGGSTWKNQAEDFKSI